MDFEQLQTATLEQIENLDFENLQKRLYEAIEEMVDYGGIEVFANKTFSLNVKYNGLCDYKVIICQGEDVGCNMCNFLTLDQISSLCGDTAKTRDVVEEIRSFVEENNENPGLGGFNYVPLEFRRVVELQEDNLLHKINCNCTVNGDSFISKDEEMWIYKDTDKEDVYIIKVFEDYDNQKEQFSTFKYINKSELEEFEKQNEEQGYVNFAFTTLIL